jgi:hypothetical protein
MATKKTHGKSHSGTPITDELVVELCEKAGAGVDVEEIESRRGGRPPMGSAPASVESVRLDPELRQALLDGGDQRRSRRYLARMDRPSGVVVAQDGSGTTKAALSERPSGLGRPFGGLSRALLIGRPR